MRNVHTRCDGRGILQWSVDFENCAGAVTVGTCGYVHAMCGVLGFLHCSVVRTRNCVFPTPHMVGQYPVAVRMPTGSSSSGAGVSSWVWERRLSRELVASTVSRSSVGGATVDCPPIYLNGVLTSCPDMVPCWWYFDRLRERCEHTCGLRHVFSSVAQCFCPAQCSFFWTVSALRLRVIVRKKKKRVYSRTIRKSGQVQNLDERSSTTRV